VGVNDPYANEPVRTALEPARRTGLLNHSRSGLELLDLLPTVRATP